MFKIEFAIVDSTLSAHQVKAISYLESHSAVLNMTELLAEFHCTLFSPTLAELKRTVKHVYLTLSRAEPPF